MSAEEAVGIALAVLVLDIRSDELEIWRTAMKRKLSMSLIGLAATLLVGLSALAQAGHPLKGSWSGDWGPRADQRNRVLLLLDWDGKEITGVINPGRNAVPLTSATLDPSDWTVRLEARGPGQDGSMVPYVIEGKVENLGSWTNRRISGTWRRGDEVGDFLVVLN
jgi:hypothetical protein